VGVKALSALTGIRFSSEHHISCYSNQPSPGLQGGITESNDNSLAGKGFFTVDSAALQKPAFDGSLPMILRQLHAACGGSAAGKSPEELSQEEPKACASAEA
jgi:hypothetical protein